MYSARLSLLALFLAGCAFDVLPPPEAPPSRVPCATLTDCTAARARAREHLGRCRSRPACDAAQEEMIAAASVLVRLEEQHKAEEVREREAQRMSERQDREDAKDRAQQAQRVVEDAEWEELDKTPCATTGDAEACEKIDEFERKWPNGEHIGEAVRVRAAGRAVLAAQRRLERERIEEAERKAQEGADRAAAATRHKDDADASGDDPPTHIRCCDGTASPTCVTVHRGCCSHHGGVCQ